MRRNSYKINQKSRKHCLDTLSLGCDAASSKFIKPQQLLQCVTFNGKVKHFKTEIVIDSGSGITILSFELYNLINICARKLLELFSRNIAARTATGENLDIASKTMVELRLISIYIFLACGRPFAIDRGSRHAYLKQKST